MGEWIRIATSTAAGPVCIAITVIGLVLSYFAWRRKGARSAMRGVAWSLLPAVAWLTGSAHLIGQIGSAIVSFAQSFAFSPKTWLGVVLVCLSVVLFLVTGGLPLLQRGRQKEAAGRAKPADKQREKKDTQKSTAIAPAAKGGQAAAASGEDDLGDVEDILRKHGIK